MKSIKIVFPLLLSVLIMVSCGEKSETQSDSNKVVEFNLTGDDQMKFNLKAMVVKEGEIVKVNFKNIGVMAKEVMGHNFVLLKSGVDGTKFAAKATTAKDFEYIPQDELDNIIVYSKLLGPGEETVIEFEAPAQGTYKYICSFPGHYTTMQGNLIVR